MGNPRSLLARYRQLGLWGRMSFWGSFASIIGLALFFFWPQAPSLNQTANVNHSAGNITIQSGRDTVITGTSDRSQSLRIKYSGRQIIDTSNFSDIFNQTLNLDNIVTLVLSPHFDNTLVELSWPSAPPLNISKPTPGNFYKMPGTDQIVEFEDGVTFLGAQLMASSRNVMFNSSEHQIRLLRVQDRIFRIKLDSIQDKRTKDLPMSFQYTFAISELDPTYENIRRSVAEDDYGPEKYLRTFRENREGGLGFFLPEVTGNKPNIVRLQAGGKAFLFDPAKRQVSFSMTTLDGRQIVLEHPLNQSPDGTGRHLIVMTWDEQKGAKLVIDKQIFKDGVK